MAVWLAMIIGAYLFGSIPTAYLAGKTQGIDLRKAGTTQVGGGNLWRMTSWKLGLPVSIFDGLKGLMTVWLAELLGLDVTQQMVVGMAAIAGHNWPVFLRFYGGRALSVAMGIFVILPIINNMTPWPSMAFLAVMIIGRLVLGSSPLPVLAGLIAAPIVSWALQEPVTITLSFAGILLLIIIKRLTAESLVAAAGTNKSQVLCNRLLFDRDIRDRKLWMYRKSIAEHEQWED